MIQLSLFELTNVIKTKLEKNLDPSYWVIAEISDLKINAKGHCYLELVEKEGHFVSAKIRANIWAYTYRNLSAWFESITKTSLQPGIKVLLNATVQYHELYGMSLNIKDIDPNFTLGERARKRQEIILQLKEEGIFDMNRELGLPLVPQRIAVISSETAAGYGDFMSQITSNEDKFSFKTTLFPSLMQGSQAPTEIIASLLKINEQINEFDLIVIIRGGGSQVDLDCFDDYQLTSYIAQFPIPIITGIGHERDETISDLVAHTKLKTPTAVAEFLISGLERFDEKLNESAYRLERSGLQQLQQGRNALTEIGHELQSSVKNVIYIGEKQTDAKAITLKYAVNDFFKSQKRKVDNFELPLEKAKNLRLAEAEKRLTHLEKQLALIHPDAVLRRGYTITLHKGKMISAHEEISIGEEIETITAQKRITSTVKKTEQ
ncbi:MAG: exodeoxyribonuclease VII large subunit [Roseivirga sp.]|jgi:exodeoxyribonuclease VII large subunit